MPQQFDDELRGVLFKNDKNGNENAPDYKGRCQIDGVEHPIAAWIKTSAKGVKFMSLSFVAAPSRERDQESPRRRRDTEDDIPF